MFGFESAYNARTLGTAFLWYLYITLSFFVMIILTPFKNVRHLGKLRGKLENDLKWNPVLRTVMQTSLELTFCSYFTLKYAKFENSLCVIINFSYAALFVVLLIIFPIFTVIFYHWNFKIIKGVDFKTEAYGIGEDSDKIKCRVYDVDREQKFENLCEMSETEEA